MLIRKFSAIVRGRVTPFQITAACVLGSMLGFVPMFGTARGLVVALVLALLILNANLFLAGIAMALAKLVSLAIVPATFAVGRVLLDGPADGLFRWAVNAPVLALFGLEHYLTTGGIVVGAAMGIVLAVLLVRAIGSFRRRMASIEDSSNLYKKLASRRSVRVLMFVLIGKGKGKKSYADLLGQRVGNPLRIAGVAIALVAVGLLFIGKSFLTERLLTRALVRGLEQANGATVDLDAAHLSLTEQRLTLTGLAMADRADLTRDLFRAATIEADVDLTDLLRGRLTLDRVAVADALQGASRPVPGRLMGTRRPRAPTQTPAPQGSKPLEDYLAQAQKWMQRLEQIADLLDRIPRSDPDAQPTDPAQAKRDRAELLRRRVALLGYARVRADHLIEGSPILLVRVLDVDGLGVQSEPSRLYDVHAEHVSTQPWLVPEPTSVRVASRDGDFDASLVLDRTIDFAIALKNLDADEVSKGLSTPEPLMRGGTLDASITGAIGPGPTHAIDLPLRVTLHNTRLALPQIGSTDVNEFTLSIEVAGSLDDPRILVDPDALTQALADAGANELANLLQKELGKILGDIDPNTGELGEEINKKAGDIIKGLLGGGG